MKYVLVNFLSFILLQNIICCSTLHFHGQIHSSNSAPLNLKDTNQKIEVSNGDILNVTIEKKGRFYNSEVVLQSANQSMKIKLHKSWYTGDYEFNGSSEQTGLNLNLKGYFSSKLVKDWEENGTNKCDAGGDCGFYHRIHTRSGTLGSFYWVHSVCWGNQDVLWQKKLVNESYKIEFGTNSYFESESKVREDHSIKKYLSSCKK